MVKRFLFIFIPMWGLLTAAVWFLYQSEVRSEKAIIASSEAQHLKLQSEAIASYFYNVLSDLELLSNLHELKQLANNMGDYSREEIESDFLSFSLGKGLYDQIRFLDKSGMELMRVNFNNKKPKIVPKSGLQNKAKRYYFIETAKLSKGEVFISPLDLNMENGEVERPIKPMIRFGNPIFDSAGEMQGVLILNYMAGELLKEFQGVAHHSVGEHSLLNQEGYWLAGPDSAEEWGFMFDEGRDKTFKLAFPKAWQIVNVKAGGQFENVKGLFTFTTFYPALEAHRLGHAKDISKEEPDPARQKALPYRWKIVSHIPPDIFSMEVHKKPTQLFERLIKVYALLLLLTGIGGATLARSVTIRRKAEEELIASEEKMRLLLESTGEAMYGTDLDGLCTFVNPPCVATLGYTRESDLLGKNMHDLIHHTKKDGAPYPIDECKLYLAVWAGVGTNVDDEVFWREDGTSFPAEYWSHPIRRDGEIIGTVVTFNDITERKLSEEVLIVNKETLAKAQEVAHMGSWDWYMETGQVTWSDEVYRIFGLRPNELEPGYEAFLSFVHPEDREYVTQRMEALMRDANPLDIEHRIIRPTGEMRIVSQQGVVYRNDLGKSARMVGSIHDITERRKAEDLVRLSSENYQNLFKYANDGIFIVDRKTLNILDVNKNGARRLGYTKKELLKMKMSDLYFSDDWEKNAEFIEDLQKMGRALFETVQKRKDGLSLPVEMSSRVIDYEGREVFQNFVRDITERKYTEAKIREYYEELEDRVRERTSEVRRLYEAIEQSGEMVMITDIKGVIEYVNPATEKITGYDKETLIGGKPAILASGRHGDEFYKKLWSTILSGNAWNGNIINKKKAGSLYHEEMTISPLKNDAGVTTHFVAIKRDITERVHAQEALVGAKNEAEKANKAKTVFLSSMSHELRTPLNAILGFTQLIMTDQKKPPSPEQKSNLKRILLSGDHLLALINEVLDLSKIEAGRLKIEEEDFAIEPVILEAIAQLEQLATKQKVKIHGYKDDKAKFIHADIIRFKQVMLNLVSNAVKYNNEEGEVTITSRPAKNGMLRIEVTDTGRGIPTAKFDTIFEPFMRLGAETSSIEGTGIGLTITKRLVEGMGGKIGFTSVVGDGTRFYIYLKKGRLVESRAKGGGEPTEKMGEQKVETAKTLLYVEDDRTNLTLVKNILERRDNITMLSAERGDEGLRAAFREKPDIILLDIDLPDMDGYEVLKRLKTSDETKEIPVVAVSANAMPEDIEKGKAHGFQNYITKPINVNRFLEIVDNTLAKGSKMETTEKKK